MANDSLSKIQSELNLTPKQATAFKNLICVSGEMSDFLIKLNSRKALSLVQRWNAVMIDFILS